MRILIQLFTLILINSLLLVGCHGNYGNVVPQQGPTMEQVYDGMGAISNRPSTHTPNQLASDGNREDLAKIRKDLKLKNTQLSTTSSMAVNNGFKKAPNPELSLYVFPHLAGNSEIPIPGYFTSFQAYERDRVVLE